jgi:ketosteroid isomerase-like protein
MQRRRYFIIIPIVTMGLAMPAAAQQVSDRDAWQAGETVVQAFNKASQAKDAAGFAALYSEDATYVTPDGGGPPPAGSPEIAAR